MNKDKEQEQRHHMKRVMLFNLNEKETSGMECSACSFHLIQQHTNEILFPSLICFLFFFALIQLNYKRKEVESVNLIEIRQSERKQTRNRIHIVGFLFPLCYFAYKWMKWSAWSEIRQSKQERGEGCEVKCSETNKGTHSPLSTCPLF